MFLEALGDAGGSTAAARCRAYRSAAQMMMGTAKLHLETGTHPGAMKDAVCSPGGTTIMGVAPASRRTPPRRRGKRHRRHRGMPGAAGCSRHPAWALAPAFLHPRALPQRRSAPAGAPLSAMIGPAPAGRDISPSGDAGGTRRPATRAGSPRRCRWRSHGVREPHRSSRLSQAARDVPASTSADSTPTNSDGSRWPRLSG